MISALFSGASPAPSARLPQAMAFIVFSGHPSSGKSLLAARVQKLVQEEGHACLMISEDSLGLTRDNCYNGGHHGGLKSMLGLKRRARAALGYVPIMGVNALPPP